MTHVFDNIYTYVSGGGGAILLSIVIKVLKNKEFKNYVKEFFKGFISFYKDKGYLTHYLFSNEMYYKTLVSAIDFEECENKNLLFKILLYTSIEVTIQKSINFIKLHKNCINKLDKNVFRSRLASLMVETKKEIKIMSVNKFNDVFKNLKEAERVFDFIYNGNDNFTGFEDYNRRYMKYITSFISNIPSYSNSNNSLLIHSYFGMIDTSLLIMIQDITECFRTMNGKLCTK